MLQGVAVANSQNTSRAVEAKARTNLAFLRHASTSEGKDLGAWDSVLLDERIRHSGGSAKVLLGIERICWVYVWADIAPVGITASIPESPSGGSRSAWDGGSVGLEEVKLIGWVFVDRTANDYQQHE